MICTYCDANIPPAAHMDLCPHGKIERLERDLTAEKQARAEDAAVHSETEYRLCQEKQARAAAEAKAGEMERRALNAERGCPCTIVEPCSYACTCANGFMSGGCSRCARYGSDKQRRGMALFLADLHGQIESAIKDRKAAESRAEAAGREAEEARALAEQHRKALDEWLGKNACGAKS